MNKFQTVLLLGAVLLVAVVSADNHPEEPECKKFKEIYGDAKTMAEEMWNGAFTYETNEALAFDMMWQVGSPNPNEAIAEALNASTDPPMFMYDTDVCHLQYFHKQAPVNTHPDHEPDSFKECHAWKDRACCSSRTVLSAQVLKEGYGEEYHWDRCGPLSQACERFFVQEACFYECEPTAGLYRKTKPHEYDPTIEENDYTHNEWQMEGMPIRASFWDAWFDACKDERFCAYDGGDFFSCAAVYEEVDEAAELKEQMKILEQKLEEDKAREAALQASLEEEKKKGGKLSGGAIGGIAVAGCFGVVAVVFAVYMISKERAGEPVFQPLNREQARAGDGTQETTFGTGA